MGTVPWQRRSFDSPCSVVGRRQGKFCDKGFLGAQTQFFCQRRAIGPLATLATVLSLAPDLQLFSWLFVVEAQDTILAECRLSSGGMSNQVHGLFQVGSRLLVGSSAEE